MSVKFSYTIGFPASHQLERGSLCGEHLHGHQYTVTLWSDTTEPFLGAAMVVGEFHRRHLNDMLPAGRPTVDGLAKYLLERLMNRGIDEVEVHESDTNIAARVSR